MGKVARVPLIASAVIVVLAVGYLSRQAYVARWRAVNSFKPTPAPSVSIAPALEVGGMPPMPEPIVRPTVPEVEVTEIARDLEIVWTVRLSSDGRLFVTERTGRILVMKPDGSDRSTYASVSTTARGESGLMGLALHPQFPREPWVYVMYTARKEGGAVNRVSRFLDRAGEGVDEQVLLDDIPAAPDHQGGALEFGPDGMLYVGTGDAREPGLAQDLSQPNGKILRLMPDGGVPPDNPFQGSAIWAYGFRNVSGLAFHPTTGELWAASHGPSSKQPDSPKHLDSVYRVRKGGNHGWPAHLGVSAEHAIASPVILFKDRPVPPGGLAFVPPTAGPSANDLLMTSLGAQELHRYVIGADHTLARFERWWPDRFGRLRGITVAPDGSVYVGTSNRDGRALGAYPPTDFVYRLRWIRG